MRGIDLNVPVGAFVVVVGPSGGSKSTFLRLLGGLDQPSSGTLCVNGVDLAQATFNAELKEIKQPVSILLPAECLALQEQQE